MRNFSSLWHEFGQVCKTSVLGLRSRHHKNIRRHLASLKSCTVETPATVGHRETLLPATAGSLPCPRSWFEEHVEIPEEVKATKTHKGFMRGFSIVNSARLLIPPFGWMSIIFSIGHDIAKDLLIRLYLSVESRSRLGAQIGRFQWIHVPCSCNSPHCPGIPHGISPTICSSPQPWTPVLLSSTPLPPSLPALL